ncbi:MAG: hypothetical protein HY959_09400 [Ignavibacteriae bacterium]|nr:hypothetical protein [Ignavibacteriota bacterium]
MNKVDSEKKFIELRSAGFSLSNIAKMLSKSQTTMVAWNKKHFSVVQSIKKTELEELRLILLEDKKSRLDFLRAELQKIKKKIDTNEIILRYEDLVNLAIKVSDAIDRTQRQIAYSNQNDTEVQSDIAENTDSVKDSTDCTKTVSKL